VNSPYLESHYAELDVLQDDAPLQDFQKDLNISLAGSILWVYATITVLA
jgi:hypothetical protein